MLALRPSKEREVGMLKSYCAWCVGEEEALRLQRLGYTSRICRKHYEESMRQSRCCNHRKIDEGTSDEAEEHVED